MTFSSFASNLVPADGNSANDIFVRDLSLGTTERVSVSSAGAESDGPSFVPYVTPDGRFIQFSSLASNLVAGDTNGNMDVFVHDRQTQTTQRVSLGNGGTEGLGSTTTKERVRHHAVDDSRLSTRTQRISFQETRTVSSTCLCSIAQHRTRNESASLVTGPRETEAA